VLVAGGFLRSRCSRSSGERAQQPTGAHLPEVTDRHQKCVNVFGAQPVCATPPFCEAQRREVTRADVFTDRRMVYPQPIRCFLNCEVFLRARRSQKPVFSCIHL